VSKRRAAGESCIYLDARGRWHGYVSVGLKADGSRDRRHVSGSSRKAVLTKVRELERTRDAGVITASGRAPSVEAWLMHWLTTIAVQRVRPSTLRWYRIVVTRHLIPNIGYHRLDRLQPEHVEALYRALSEQGMAPATVLQCHRVLSRALKVALQRGRITRNVCTLVDAPSLRPTEVVPLTAEEARRILAAAVGDRNEARWSVALALGLRQGEALGLQWDDLDLNRGVLEVRRALQRLPGVGLAFVEPKSRAGRRTLALPAPLVESLRAHRDVQSVERDRCGEEWNSLRLIFCHGGGGPIDPSADHRAWKALLTRAGVRPARLHDARHTAATLLLQQGVHPRVVMHLLGHSQIALTLGTYSHVVPELATEAAERMTAALWD
jgi:integrase